MSGPTDGYAYNRIELNAIWDLPVQMGDIIREFAHKYDFFLHSSQLDSNPEKEQDAEIVKRIKRALVAESTNPLPPFGEWNCMCHHRNGEPA